jgi:hypothetical protein
MINIQHEKLIRLEDVADYLPSSRRGKRLGRAVVFRWALHGVRGTVLETMKVGGARFTSIEAVQRFVERQNEGGEGHCPHHPDAFAKRAAAAAEKLRGRGA